MAIFGNIIEQPIGWFIFSIKIDSLAIHVTTVEDKGYDVMWFEDNWHVQNYFD